MSFNNFSEVQNIETLRTALYNNILHILQSKSIDKELLKCFKFDMVTVKIEKSKPLGLVECVLCTMKKLKTNKRMHKVRPKSTGDKHFWIASNFKKHITKDIVKMQEMKPNKTIGLKIDKDESVQPVNETSCYQEFVVTEDNHSEENTLELELVQSVNPTKSELHVHTLRSKLYYDILRVLQSKCIEKAVLKCFKLDMVTVEIEKGKPLGLVKCVLCELKSEKNSMKTKKRMHKVRTKSTGNKHSWIVSNFKKHVTADITKIHKLQLKKVNDLKSDSVQPIESLKDSKLSSETPLINKPSDGYKLKKDDYSIVNLSESISNDKNHQKDSNSTENGQCVASPPEQISSNERHPIESDSMEYSGSLIALDIQVDLQRMMYDQISYQLLEMEECVRRTAKENIREMKFILQQEFRNIKTLLIPRDGDCMFKSTAHQLNGKDMDDLQLEDLSTKVRAQVFTYIKNNESKFENTLNDRFSEENPDIPIITGNEWKLLIPKLANKGEWGGHETLVTVTILYNVNIMIVNERGDFYYNEPFDMNCKKTIFLAYCLKKLPLNSNKRNHYESILHIDQNDVYTMTKCKSSIDQVDIC